MAHIRKFEAVDNSNMKLETFINSANKIFLTVWDLEDNDCISPNYICLNKSDAVALSEELFNLSEQIKD